MSSKRFFLNTPPINDKAVLRGEEAHHLIHVLRAEKGRLIELLDGTGRVWKGIIDDICPDSVSVDHLKLLLTPSNTKRIVLIQSLCKADKLEWIFQKVTELGVAEIHLLEAKRSVVKLPQEKMKSKMERWQKIILGATKQSRRSSLPLLHPPAPCEAICKSLETDVRLLLSESAGETPLKPFLRSSKWSSAAFCIGPEGGWTAQEQETFTRFGFTPVSLGSNILRTETAAIVAAAILMYESENG